MINQRSSLSPLRQQGFTLLEILLVAILIALVAGGTTLSLSGSGPEKQLQQTADRFAGVLHLAQEEALLRGNELGLQVETDFYQFMQLNEETERWELLEGQKFFNKVELDELMAMQLTITGMPWGKEGGNDSLLEDDGLFEDDDGLFEDEGGLFDDETDDQPKLTPQVFIQSSGEVTEFELIFEYDGDTFHQLKMNVSGFGEIRYGDDEE